LHSLREASDFDPRHEYGDSAADDVFLLAAKTQAAPYIYLTCGTSEGLLGVNRSFDGLLTRRGLMHE